MLVAKRAQPLRLRRLAPTVLVSGSPLDTVLEALRAAGFSPAAEAPDGALLLAGGDARRTPLRARPHRPTEPSLPPEQAALSVTALRAGDLAARAARRAPVTTSRSTTADTLAFLQQAARERRQVWLATSTRRAGPPPASSSPAASRAASSPPGTTCARRTARSPCTG